MSTHAMQKRNADQLYSNCRPEAPLRLVEPVRRRSSAAQGRALETLGHAIEYLIDSRLWRGRDYDPKSDREAIQILMRLSREVFSECPEVISLRRRFGVWVSERVTGDTRGRPIR
jgi:hypothetical protein